MRRLAVIAAGVVVLLGLALLAAVKFIDVDHYRPQIQSELEKKLNRKVQLGQIQLGLFPFGARVQGVEIGENPAFPSQQPFAQAKDVSASVGLFSLLRKEPHVKSVRMDQPKIELIRDAKGIWNFADLGGQGQSSGQTTLDKLQIVDGQVSVTDIANHQPRTTYDHIDLTVSDFAPGKRVNFDLTAHLSGSGNQMIKASGKAGPLVQGQVAGTPIDAHLVLQEVSLASARQLGVQGIPEGTDTVASGQADVRTENGTYVCNGKLKLDKTTVRNVQLGFPIDADYKLNYDANRSLLNAQNVALRVGSTPISMSGQVDAGHDPYQVDVRVNTQNAPLAQLAKLAAAFGVAFNPKYNVNGNLTADVNAKGSAAKPALAGNLTLANLEVSGSELKQPVRVPQLVLALTPDEIRSQPFQAESGGTHVNGQLTVTKYTSPDPMIDGSLKSDGASVAELLSMAKAYGVSAMDGVNGSGNVSVDFHVQGPVMQTQNLKYSGSGSLSNVVLNTPSIPKAIEVKSANLQFQQDAVAMDNFAGSIGSSDLRGRVKVKNFAAPQLDFDLTSNKVDTSEFSAQAPAQSSPQQKPSSVPSASGSSQSGGGSMIDKVSGSGTWNAGTVIAKSVVLTNVKTKCVLDHGVIRLNPLSSELFGGTQTGTAEADLRQANPRFAINMKLAGVDVEKLLSATTSVKDKLSGKLNSTADLKFVQQQNGEIAQTLNGTTTFDVTNGRVKGTNILNELGKVGKFVKVPTPNADGTDLKKLGGTLQITNGVANTDNLVAMLDGGSLSAKGTINLVNQALDLHMTAVLANSLSQTVGGTQIGGYLNTALSNKQGELVVPVIVTGTLNNPNFAPDAGSMAKMKLQNLLPTTGNPASAISGVLGGLTGKSEGTSQNQQKPEDAIKDIFKSFGKKPEKKQ